MGTGLRSRAVTATALLCAALLFLAAAPPAAAAEPLLPAWPEDFGPEVRVTVSDHATGYSSVLGPDGQAWCFFTQRSGNNIAYTPVSPDGSPGASNTVITAAGEITALAVATDSSQAVVAWIERNGDDYALMSTPVKRSPDGGYHAEPPACLLKVGSTLSEVGIALIEGQPVIAWIDQEEGRPAAYVSVVAGGPVAGTLVRNRLSAGVLTAAQVRIAANSRGAWVTWVEVDEITSSIKCASYRDGTVGPTLSIGQGSLNEFGAVILPEADGSADVVFTKGRVVRGEQSSSLVAYGVVAQDGRWLAMPQELSSGEGFALTPMIAATDQRPAVIWAEDRNGLVGVHWLQTGQTAGTLAPTIARRGTVSYSGQDCLHPQLVVLPDRTRLAFYQKYLNESEITVCAVSSVTARPPDWRYFLGLDPANPAQDALFSLAMAVATAAASAMISFPLMAVAVIVVTLSDRLSIFSSTWLGMFLRSMFLFALLFLLKSPGKWYSGYSPALPGGQAWLSFAVAATTTLLVTRRTKLASREWMSTALAATLYMLFDILFAVIQRGVTSL